jgi:hypothetical protein
MWRKKSLGAAHPTRKEKELAGFFSSFPHDVDQLSEGEKT